MNDWIAEYLVKENFLLTALEFYQELIESGFGEQKVLKQFFEGKQYLNFNAEKAKAAEKSGGLGALGASLISGKDHKKLSVPEYSEFFEEALKKKDEQVSVLNYELNIAKQEIEKLKLQVRENLSKLVGPASKRTKASASGEGASTPSENSQNASTSVDQDADDENADAELAHLSDEPIKEHEKQVINFLVRKFLQDNEYKMTAISFSEEVGDSQDIMHDLASQNNEDVPLGLLYLYRYYYQLPGRSKNKMKDTKALHTALQQLEERKQAIKTLQQSLIQQEKELSASELRNKLLEEEVAKLKHQIASSSSSSSAAAAASVAAADASKSKDNTVAAESAKAEKFVAPAPVKVPEKPAAAAAAEKKPPVVPKSPRDSVVVDSNTSSQGILVSDSSLQREITILQQKIRDLEDKDKSVILALGEKIPKLIAATKSKSKCEILPLIITAIQYHPEQKVREILADSMFNIIKAPNETERESILQAFQSLSRLISPDMFEIEILQRAWNHFHKPEKKILIAGLCGTLTSNVKAHLRSSLFVSVLHQLSTDSSEAVRTAAAINLSKVVDTLEDDDKYERIEEIFLKLLFDKADVVVRATLDHLAPAIAKYAAEFDLGFDRYAATLLTQAEGEIFKKSPQYNPTDNLILLLQCFRIALPKLHNHLIDNIPDSITKKYENNAKGDPRKIIQMYLKEIGQDREKVKNAWKDMYWSGQTGILRCLSLIVSIDVSETQITAELTALVHDYCKLFGEAFVATFVKPLFLGVLNHEIEVPLITSKADISQDQRKLFTKARVLPIFLCGVLATGNMEDFANFTRDTIVQVAIKEKGWTLQHSHLLKFALNQACKVKKLQDEILSVTWNLIVNPANSVRQIIVQIFTFIIDALDSETISQRILPAMITLAADPDKSVRVQSLHGIGDICVNVAKQKDLDKIENQFSAFFQDPNREFTYEALRVLARTIPKVDGAFRDKYVIKKLHAIGHDNNTNHDQTDRKQIALLLFDCYRALSGCILSKEDVKNVVIPGLEMLDRDTDYMGDPSIKNSVKTMVKDMKAFVAGIDEAKKSGGEDLYSVASNVGSSSSAASQPAQPESKGIGSFFKFGKN